MLQVAADGLTHSRYSCNRFALSSRVPSTLV